jgi:uncharacterized protein YdeI (YjbR/CyaY-like superfamily)
MPTTDARVDAYIAKSVDFAQPILSHIRKLVHKACPDVTENIKWQMPFFEYAGGIICNMAGFKQHCSLGFWNASLLKDPAGVLHLKDKNAMGHLDRITTLKDLPADKILIDLIKQGAILNEQGVKKKAPAAKTPKAELPEPPALTAALRKNKKAKAIFQEFPPSHRREYIQWITEAKTDATREKRIATTIEWLEEGKDRNWKYRK